MRDFATTMLFESLQPFQVFIVNSKQMSELSPPTMSASCFHLVITAFLILAIFPPFSHPVSFDITHFDSKTNNISYQGDAIPTNSTIGLETVSQLYRVGRAAYSEGLHLWDSSTGILTDFTTRFSFIVGVQNKSNYGDGFAFYMAPVGNPIPPNSAGEYLGLFNSTTSLGVPQNQIVHVEFDTFVNPDFDPPMRHVGINNNSLISLSYANFGLEGNEGKLGHALITYNASIKTLSVFWSFNESLTTFGNNFLSQTIDLMKVLPERVTIGFSATTGLSMERNTIQSWEFNSTLNSSMAFEKKNKKIKEIVVGTCSFALVLIVACVCWLFIKKRNRSNNDDKTGNSVDFDLNKAAIPRRFYYHELVAATDGFSEDRKLGREGSG